MIRIEQLKLAVDHTEAALEAKIRRLLRLRPEELLRYTIKKRSIDARKKPELFYSYVIDCKVAREEAVLQRADGRRVTRAAEKAYRFPPLGERRLTHPPVIVGTGPAGLFCGWMLARHGYRPILLERGKAVSERLEDVRRFWETGILNPGSNVQFGEGGAGTFSDGKLNTLVKDKEGRNLQVLRLFVEAGADESILYEQKPHLGTDALVQIVESIRKRIEDWGGVVRFESQVTGIRTENGSLTGLVIREREILPCEAAVFAIGHSARDTFQMLYDRGVEMEAKEFAVGFRVEHRQETINLAQYGMADPAPLSAAPYKVTARTTGGRGVYSFCMCPGGYVVNASSEPGRLAVNGMSYSGRDGENANSAVIVSVRKSDFASAHPLAGIAFQRELEERTFQAGNGKIPVQRLGDFRKALGKTAGCGKAKAEKGRPGTDRLGVNKPLLPCMKGAWAFADLTQILPGDLNEGFLEGMDRFGEMIRGFADDDTLVSAVESRTSSPVRIPRDESFQCNKKGLYPCGEGAGYAGGIMSAAMDGIRAAEKIAESWRPFEEMKEK